MSGSAQATEGTRRKPDWLKARLPAGGAYFALKQRLAESGLHTICQSARCPNAGECWQAGQATFLVLGSVCSRDCRFCAVTAGAPLPPDADEPRRVAEMAAAMGLRYAVVTSVSRDDLPDQGSGHFAAVVAALKQRNPGIGVEALVPDFSGRADLLQPVLAAGVDVLAHNIETVARLYPHVNRRAEAYGTSLRLLATAKRLGWVSKSGLMVGLGESRAEIAAVLADLRRQEVDLLTIGQYLQPDRRSLPVARYYTPGEFADLRQEALACGFRGVESAPLVRSSYRAEELFRKVPRALPHL